MDWRSGWDSEGKGRTHGRAIFWSSTWWYGWRVRVWEECVWPTKDVWIQSFRHLDMLVEAFVYVSLELRRGLRAGMYICKALAHDDG